MRLHLFFFASFALFWSLVLDGYVTPMLALEIGLSYSLVYLVLVYAMSANRETGTFILIWLLSLFGIVFFHLIWAQIVPIDLWYGSLVPLGLAMGWISFVWTETNNELRAPALFLLMSAAMMLWTSLVADNHLPLNVIGILPVVIYNGIALANVFYEDILQKLDWMLITISTTLGLRHWLLISPLPYYLSVLPLLGVCSLHIYKSGPERDFIIKKRCRV
jgi:hypothetical protein